ncbi:MAG: hypothetical protein WBP59_14505 [Ilumatobacteraceae bacterium]
MYLFTRSTVAAVDRQPEAITAALEVGAIAADATGWSVNVFATVSGAPTGTITWATTIASFAELEAGNEQLLADDAYVAKVDSMRGLFAVPAEDGLMRFLSSPINAATSTSRYYGVTRASMSPGHFAEAAAFGVRCADYIAASNLLPCTFVKSGYGGFGDVGWIVGFEGADGVDAFDEWQMSDSTYLEMLNEAAPLFVDNTGHTSLIRRLN